MQKNSPWRLLWLPKNWVFAPLLGLLRLMVFLPYRMQMRIGSALGYLIYLFDRSGKHTARINLKLCFPKLSDTERHQLLKKNYQAIGFSIVETALAWFGTDQQLPPVKIHGLEHWQNCYHKNKGVLLISCHLSCLEIAGRLIKPYMTVNAVYRPQKLALLDALVHYYRQKIYPNL